MAQGFGFRVSGLMLKVNGSGFRVQRLMVKTMAFDGQNWGLGFGSMPLLRPAGRPPRHPPPPPLLAVI